MHRAAGILLGEGGGDGGVAVQQDAYELLAFFLATLNAPWLPLAQTLIHGSDRADQDDYRRVTGRALLISIPSPTSPPRPTLTSKILPKSTTTPFSPPIFQLEHLLWRHFFDDAMTKDEGVEREIVKGDKQRVPVLRVLKISPFYTCESETDGAAENRAAACAAAAAWKTVVIPIVLMRYGFSRHAAKKKVMVDIPLQIEDFSEFVEDSDLNAGFALCLRSAVLHIGDRISEGHYVAIGRDDSLYQGQGGWLLHDDMAPSVCPLPAFRTSRDSQK